MARLLFGVLALACIATLVGAAYTTQTTTAHDVRIGQSLIVQITLASNSGGTISDVPCDLFAVPASTYYGSAITDTLDFRTYVGYKPETVRLKTSIDGLAVFNLPIDDRYQAYNNYSVIGSCAGARSSSNFTAIPATTPNLPLNAMLTGLSDMKSWLLILFFAIFVGSFIWYAIASNMLGSLLGRH